MTSIQSFAATTPALALTLARRLNARGYYAAALAEQTPTVHVNLTGTNRAIIHVVWDEWNMRHFYHGHMEVGGKRERLFTDLGHPALEALLARY